MQEDGTKAANALVQTRIDGAVKDEAAAVLKGMELTVSDVVRLMLMRARCGPRAPAGRARGR